jgi:uncharacterized protein (DUF1778 family)
MIEAEKLFFIASVKVNAEQRRKIKTGAGLCGLSMRRFVVEAALLRTTELLKHEAADDRTVIPRQS